MRKPKLNFLSPRNEKQKRKWHVLRILGKGVDLLCKSTNARAKRRLGKSNSDAYKNRWKDLTKGARFCTFFGAYLGCSILGVGSRHLMQQKPYWLSQLGDKKLFEKLPTDLFRLWCANFVAYTRRDTNLFKQSIREQRIRFYGAEKFSRIIYENSIAARDPPNTISGDETITRLYTQKATDIRMRTSKKNESGALNQNLCGSNEGYTT